MKKYDLIVVGGGLSGACATISASRQGLKVLLLEKSNSLGGTATGGLVLPFMPNETVINGQKTYLWGSIFKEIREELNKLGATWYESFREEELKLILNRMVSASGADILFHAYLTGVDYQGGKINSISASTIEGTLDFCADYFIDATGDGQLCYLAGIPFVLGREKDNLCQPMTLSFRVGGVDTDAFFEGLEELNKEYKKHLENGEFINPRENILVFKTAIDSVLHFNTTRVIKKNPTSATELTEAEIEAREQVYEAFDFIKKYGKGVKNAYVLSTGNQIGVRESRKIVGEYTLTGKECEECTKFEDSICACNYDIDIHNPEGSGTSHHYFNVGEYYQIPYRTLIPKSTSNILVVGRCISCDHGAQASTRIMPVVSAIGEAGGVAIAQAFKNSQATTEIDVKELQDTLKANGSFIG
jgi:hypothetical protein